MVAEADNKEGIKQDLPKRTDKREAIVQAAQGLFTTVGYDETTMAQVAKKAGVAVGTVYLYFKNKRELLYAVKDDWEMEFVQYMQQPELLRIPHAQRARPLVEAVFRLCRARTEMVQLMGLAPQTVGEIYHYEGGDLIRQAVKAFLDEGVAFGSFRDVNTKLASVLVYAMVNGALEQCFYVEGGANQDSYIDALVDGLEHYLAVPELLAHLESSPEAESSNNAS